MYRDLIKGHKSEFHADTTGTGIPAHIINIQGKAASSIRARTQHAGLTNTSRKSMGSTYAPRRNALVRLGHHAFEQLLTWFLK